MATAGLHIIILMERQFISCCVNGNLQVIFRTSGSGSRPQARRVQHDLPFEMKTTAVRTYDKTKALGKIHSVLSFLEEK